MALAWLNKILNEAKPEEDGKIDAAAISAQIEAELPKHTAPRADYEKVLQERDAAQTQLANVKGADIAELQEQLRQEKSGRKKDKQDWMTRAKLEKMGAQDADYLMYKLGDPAELFDDEGKFKDEKAFETKLKTDYPTQFKEEGSDFNYDPRGNNSGGSGEKDLGSLSMEDYIKARTK